MARAWTSQSQRRHRFSNTTRIMARAARSIAVDTVWLLDAPHILRRKNGVCSEGSEVGGNQSGGSVRTAAYEPADKVANRRGQH